MSEYEQQDKQPSDNKDTPKKLSKSRLAMWEQPSSQQPSSSKPTPLQSQPPSKTPPPRPGGLPNTRPNDSGESSQQKPSILKPKRGFDRHCRVYLRESLEFELPQPPDVKQAIQEKMIDSQPVKQDKLPSIEPIQPLRQRRRGPPPPLQRTQKLTDLSDMANQAWTELHDNAMNRMQTFIDGFNQAKSRKRSVLGNQGLTDLRRDLNQKADAGLQAAQRFLSIQPPGQDQSNVRSDLRRDKRRPALAKLQKAVEARVAEVNKLRKAIEDVFADTGQAPDDLGQALDTKQRGIRFSDLKVGQYGDDKLDRGQSQEDFAGGAVNKVSSWSMATRRGSSNPRHSPPAAEPIRSASPASTSRRRASAIATSPPRSCPT